MLHTRLSSGRLTAAARCAPSTAPRSQIHRRARLQRADAALKDAALVPVMEKGELTQYPEAPGVYAVYNAAGELQYVGLSRKVCVLRLSSVCACCGSALNAGVTMDGQLIEARRACACEREAWLLPCSPPPPHAAPPRHPLPHKTHQNKKN